MCEIHSHTTYHLLALAQNLADLKDDILKRQKERESRIAVQMRKLLSTSAELRTPLLSILAFHHLGCQ